MDRTWTHHSNAIIHSSVCWMHKQIEKLWPNFHFALPVFSLPHFPAPLSWRKSAQSNRRQSCPGRCLFSVFLFMNTPPPPHTFSSVKHTHGVKGGWEKDHQALPKTTYIWTVLRQKFFAASSKVCLDRRNRKKKEMTEKSKVHKIWDEGLIQVVERFIGLPHCFQFYFYDELDASQLNLMLNLNHTIFPDADGPKICKKKKLQKRRGKQIPNESFQESLCLPEQWKPK